jgi:hypothetical protein
MIKKNILTLTIVLLIFLFLGQASLYSQSSKSNGITLTWKDLQELLGLNTDKIKISLEEFRKLMKQTGVNIEMALEIKDGMVTLRRDQFRRLIGKMKTVDKAIPKPPRNYLVTEAKYSGTAGKENSHFNASFKIYVFEGDRTGYINIPVVHSSLAVKDIQVNGLPALILHKGNWHNISVKTTGYHVVKVDFSVGNTKQKVFLPVVRSIINQMEFSVPKIKTDIHINPSIESMVISKNDSTYTRANSVPTDNFEISWVRKAEKSSKQPVLFYAKTRSLIAVDDDILRVSTKVTLEVIKSTLEGVSLQVPKNYEIIKVDGISENQWQVRDTNIGRILEINFRYQVDRSVAFTIHSERMLPADLLVADFNGFKVLEARRETGDIGVVAESTVQVDIEEFQGESQGLEKIKYHKLPKGFLNMSSRPILFAYKYVKHPIRLEVKITKHRRVEGMNTVIKSAEITALFLKEGKMIYRVIYTVNNIFKQFMELAMPKQAEIWTVYVDQRRGKASLNERGKVLIPLLRSSGNGQHVKPFKIELVYAIPCDGFRFSGEGECLIPSCDIFINKMKVKMYLPQEFKYSFDEKGWIKDKITSESMRDPYSQGFVSHEAVATEAEEGDKDRIEDFGLEAGIKREEQAVVTGKIDSIKERKKNVTGPAGLSSINVHLPLSGDCFTFSKKIIDKDESFSLNFSYYKNILKKVVFYLFVSFLIFSSAFILNYRLKRSKAV